jgi:hypothetical protein
LTSIEKELFRRTAEYTFFGNKRNEGVLKAKAVEEKLRRYKSN